MLIPVMGSVPKFSELRSVPFLSTKMELSSVLVPKSATGTRSVPVPFRSHNWNFRSNFFPTPVICSEIFHTPGGSLQYAAPIAMLLRPFSYHTNLLLSFGHCHIFTMYYIYSYYKRTSFLQCYYKHMNLLLKDFCRVFTCNWQIP